VGELHFQAIAVLLLSFIGGLATYLQGVIVLGKARSKANLLLDLLLSVLAGFGAWFLCVSEHLGIWLTLFCVLVAGLNGAEILRAFKQKLHSVLGIGRNN